MLIQLKGLKQTQKCLSWFNRRNRFIAPVSICIITVKEPVMFAGSLQWMAPLDDDV